MSSSSSAQKKPHLAEASNSPEPDLIIGGENIIKETGQKFERLLLLGAARHVRHCGVEGGPQDLGGFAPPAARTRQTKPLKSTGDVPAPSISGASGPVLQAPAAQIGSPEPCWNFVLIHSESNRGKLRRSCPIPHTVQGYTVHQRQPRRCAPRILFGPAAAWSRCRSRWSRPAPTFVTPISLWASRLASGSSSRRDFESLGGIVRRRRRNWEAYQATLSVASPPRTGVRSSIALLPGPRASHQLEGRVPPSDGAENER
jgi:hypothetical protein